MATKTSENGSEAKGILGEVAEAVAAMPDLNVPAAVVAELVALALQTELGDALWRGFCAGRGYPEPMRLGIESVEAVAGVMPNAPRRT